VQNKSSSAGKNKGFIIEKLAAAMLKSIVKNIALGCVKIYSTHLVLNNQKVKEKE